MFARAFFFFAAAIAFCEEWPGWRGPNADGTSNDTAIPMRWSKTENIRWRVPLPEPGNSTPVVWRNRVFVTQAVKEPNRRTLMCFDRASGKLLWQSGVNYSAPEPTHQTNPYASASPVTDGERVVAWFGSAGLVAFDFNGRELWRNDLGKQHHTWGYGSSPVLDRDRVYLNFGPGERSFLVAVDKRSGKTVWQVDVPAGAGMKFANWDPKDMYGSWSTPLLIRAGSRDELVVSHPRRVSAYDPPTGKLRWTSDGMGDLVYPSPLLAKTASGEPLVIAMGGFTTASLAVKPGGSSDVTATHRLWHLPKSRPMIGSGVTVRNRLFLVDNGGIAECLDVETGKTVWTGRLRGAGDDNGVWSSPVLSADRIYVMNKSGDTIIFKAGPEFEVLAVNSIGEPTNSSVVISDGEIFLRTHQALWKIGIASGVVK